MKKLVLLVCVLACTAAAGLLHHSGRLDRTPPRIELQVPDGPLSGDVAVEINVADLTPGLSEVRLSVDDGPPQRLDIDPSGHTTWTWPGGPGRPPGPHTLRVQATDSAWKPNTAELSIQRTTDDQPPELRFKLVPDRPAQGTVAALFVWADEPLSSVQIDGLDQTRPAHPLQDGGYRALLGIGVTTPAEPAQLVLQASDALGNTTACTVPVEVTRTDFPRGGYIRLSRKQVKARTDAEALAAMRAARTGAYTFVDPVQHWTGPATRPVQGRRTSRFGRYRTYSDGRRKHHLGTDLANITGTPVHAALSGVVRAAGWQHLFGNAVIVHHGQGLTTSYNHLSAIDVTEGDPIEQGQVVGKLGSTGQSTGPHLHWGMQVGEVEVDPERWPDHAFSPSALGLTGEAATRCSTRSGPSAP